MTRKVERRRRRDDVDEIVAELEVERERVVLHGEDVRESKLLGALLDVEGAVDLDAVVERDDQERDDPDELGEGA